jgi:hypothetical protein
MNNEIVFAIGGVQNVAHADRLKEMAIDKRRKFKDIVQKGIYLKSPEFLKKLDNLGRTTPEFAMVGEIGLMTTDRKYLYALRGPKNQPHQAGDVLDQVEYFESEGGVITAFWDQFRKEYDTLARYGHSYPVVGHNILSWGLPFLLKRSSIRGITASRELPLRTDYNAGIYDLAMKWDQSSHPWSSLKFMSEIFGLDYDGSLESELDTIWEIYKKMKGNLVW